MYNKSIKKDRTSEEGNMNTLRIIKRVANVKERKQGYNWTFVKEFNNPGEADQWLTNHIRENKLVSSDWTIQRLVQD